MPSGQQAEDDILWIRRDFLESEQDHGRVVVHGHTIQPGVEIGHNRINLDTGAYRSGILGAVALEEDGSVRVLSGEGRLGC